jgi:hypothetical protein
VLEVGVAVQEGKTIAAPAAQCEERSEHNAAIAAEQDGKAAGAERGIDGTGNIAGYRRDPVRIQDPGLRVAHAIVRRHVDTHRVRGAEAPVEARPPQRVRSFFQPARAKPERGRHLNDLGNHRPSPN